eukprot:767051-Hanusia_phi.AAC.1
MRTTAKACEVPDMPSAPPPLCSLLSPFLSSSLLLSPLSSLLSPTSRSSVLPPRGPQLPLLALLLPSLFLLACLPPPPSLPPPPWSADHCALLQVVSAGGEKGWKGLREGREEKGRTGGEREDSMGGWTN